MNLIEILKGARKRIEAAEYLADGNYHEDNIMYGKCYCAAGHIFKEMKAEDEDMDVLEGSYLSDFDDEWLVEHGKPIHEKIRKLTPILSSLYELQLTNDESKNNSRKENVLAKLDEIISEMESEQNGNPSN